MREGITNDAGVYSIGDNEIAFVRSDEREKIERMGKNPFREEEPKLTPAQLKQKREADSWMQWELRTKKEREEREQQRIAYQNARAKQERDAEKREKDIVVARWKVDCAQQELKELYESHHVSPLYQSEINERMSNRKTFGNIYRHTEEILRLKKELGADVVASGLPPLKYQEYKRDGII